MAEEKIVTEETARERETNQENGQEIVVKLEKPYLFEGKEYSEIDLNGLHNLTVKDAIEIQRQLFSEQEVAAAVLRRWRQRCSARPPRRLPGASQQRQPGCPLSSSS